MPVTFYAKNLDGEIKEITYYRYSKIPTLIEESFGKTPLYSHVSLSLNKEGECVDYVECKAPKKGYVVYVLFKYKRFFYELLPTIQ